MLGAVRAEDEYVHSAVSPTFSDEVTFAFADRRTDVYAFARVALSPPFSAHERAGTALALLWRGQALRASVTAPRVAVPAESDWHAFALAGVATTTPGPLDWWSVAFVDEEGRHGFELVFEAIGPPAVHADSEGIDRVAGTVGYDHVCRVQGKATIAGVEHPIACHGQRNHTWGGLDSRVALARRVGLWLDGDRAFIVRAARPAGENGGLDETVSATLLDATRAVAAYDADLVTSTERGLQRRADFAVRLQGADRTPVRARGTSVCAAALQLPRVRLDLAFFAWTVGDRSAVGCYEIVRPIDRERSSR